MSPSETGVGACPPCLRRRWLIGELSAMLDYRRSRPTRLLDALELDDLELIAALGGSRRELLLERWRRFDPSIPCSASEHLCAHRAGYPDSLRDLAHPPALQTRDRAARISKALSAPSVALSGGGECSAHGARVAAMLARSLAMAGVTVIASASHQLGRAAIAACEQQHGACVAVLDRGLGEERGSAAPLALTELAPASLARPWTRLACERLVAALAQVTVIVEARAQERDLLAAQVARSLGRPLAATPGLITNALAAGPHELIAGGARLVACAEDVLELLPASEHGQPPELSGRAHTSLGANSKRVLLEIGAGAMTIEELTRRAGSSRGVLSALGELEALGLIERARGGRYLAREPAAAARLSEGRIQGA